MDTTIRPFWRLSHLQALAHQSYAVKHAEAKGIYVFWSMWLFAIMK